MSECGRMGRDDLEPLPCPVCGGMPSIVHTVLFRWEMGCKGHHGSHGMTYVEALEWWNDGSERERSKGISELTVPMSPVLLPCPVCGFPPGITRPTRASNDWFICCGGHHGSFGPHYEDVAAKWNDEREREESRRRTPVFPHPLNELDPCPICGSEPSWTSEGGVWVCSCGEHHRAKGGSYDDMVCEWGDGYQQRRSLMLWGMRDLENQSEERMRDMLRFIGDRLDLERLTERQWDD